VASTEPVAAEVPAGELPSIDPNAELEGTPQDEPRERQTIPAPPPVPEPPPAPPEPPPPPKPDGTDKVVTVTKRFLTLNDSLAFDQDSSLITPKHLKALATLAKVINARPWIQRVWIEGQADLKGPPEWNIILSRLRARHVQRALTKMGVDENRLRAIASGEKLPDSIEAIGRITTPGRAVNFYIEAEDAPGGADVPAPQPGGPTP
jgi:outer membrane protein OmpA-like peptidoglycan-associated protein